MSRPTRDGVALHPEPLREDLRPRAETTLRDLCALLYPATVGHDVVVYAAGDGPWSARWRWAARVVDGRADVPRRHRGRARPLRGRAARRMGA